MQSVNENFEELRLRLQQGTNIRNAGDDPVFYLIFPPDKIIEVKKKLKTWFAKLKKDGWNIETFSMTDATHKIFKNYELRDQWLEVEKDNPFEFEEINQTLKSSLLNNNALLTEIKSVLEKLEGKKDTLLFIVDVEALHPYIRVGAIEQNLTGKFTIPTIILYPGTREGNSLRFLGVYPPDGNYRSIHIGG
jgi:hypothetical protein